MSGLDVVGCGSSWSVIEGGTVLATRGSQLTALLTLDRIQRTRQITRRPCLCCDQPFKSTGPGHRLCGPCKREFA